MDFSPSKNKERKDSEIERILIMISKCLAMNVENGITMAGSLFTKANWKQLGTTEPFLITGNEFIF